MGMQIDVYSLKANNYTYMSTASACALMYPLKSSFKLFQAVFREHM